MTTDPATYEQGRLAGLASIGWTPTKGIQS
jgi:hypothetical protein